MKKQLINIWTAPVIRIIGCIFIVAATILAVSAVVAQPYGKSSQYHGMHKLAFGPGPTDGRSCFRPGSQRFGDE